MSAAMEKMLWSVLLLLPAEHDAAAGLGAVGKKLRDCEEGLVPNVTLVSIGSKSPRLTRDIVGKGDTVTQMNCVVRTLLCKQLRKRNVPNAVHVAADSRKT